VEQPHIARTSVIAQFALLSAIIVLMAFTPLGYAHIGLVEATLLMIPVALGAIRLGPLAGAALGAVFGLTSFIQCFGASVLGTALLSISPLSTLVVCMVPRILMGLLVGLIYRGLAQPRTPDAGHDEHDQWIAGSVESYEILSRRTDAAALPVAFLSSALLNTVLFVAFFLFLFGRSQLVVDLRAGQPLLAFIASLIGINGIAEAAVATVAGTAIGSAVQRAIGHVQDA
jgi:uncharacterized membrane protein